MLVTFPLLLLLFSGSHELTPSVEWFIQGDFDDTHPSEDRSDELAWEDTDEYTVETVRGILYGTVGSKVPHKHFAQHPKDDFQALVPLVDKFIQGDDSRDVDASEDSSNYLVRKDSDEYIAETLRGIQYGTVGSKTPHDSRKHFVQHPKDDNDLDLVMNFLRNGSYDKTGQLKYDSVPVVESELVKDILDVIYSREEYVRLLNNPERPVMTEIVKEMIRIPTQTVLQQQLFHKIVEERAWRKKFIDPMVQDDKRNKLINFGRHLLEAKRNGTLSTEDTTDFNNNLENFAFFDREEDKEFKGLVDQLIEAFGRSVHQTQNNESIARSVALPPSTDQVANKLNAHRHGFFDIIPETEDQTTVNPTSPPTTDAPKKNSNRVSYLLPKFHRSEFRATGRSETTTMAPFDDTTTAVFIPTSDYRTTRGYVHSSEAPYTTTGPSDSETTTAVYVPTSDYRTTRGYVHSTEVPYTTTGPSDGETTTAEYVSTSDHRTTRGYVHSTEPPYTTTGPSDGEATTAEYDPTSDYRTTRGYVHSTEAPYTTTGPSDGETTTAEYVSTSDHRTTRGYVHSTEPPYTTTGPSDGEATTAEYDPTSDYRTTRGYVHSTEAPYTTTARYGTTTDSYGTTDNQEYTTTSGYKPTSSFAKQRNWLDASMLYSKKSDQTESKNSSEKVSSIVKDDVTEIPIVYVRGLNDDGDDDSSDLRTEKDSIKTPENKNFNNSNKNLINKTSTGKSVDNLSGKVSSIVEDDVTENAIVYVRGLNDDDGDGSFKSGSKKDSIKIHMTPSGTETARLSSLYKNAPVNKKAATVENNNANKTIVNEHD
ncbi:hypothetical protein CAEBREN_14368 [Caenorhabditis brenneri]|uniref:Uncharacterized protein n=1 Tax=Caenorhabditis brenneri TaxID=135651 RepID=G0MAF8_CAEBE|nr:hypothetical protein CAEBREN_14368 [Caenorhabditis brenneri]